GKVDDETKRLELESSDVLCAPSLGGESFGMVLTEAFAAGTPVVASDIAGYRDVVRDGVDGVLVPRGNPQALAEALRDLYEDPVRRAAMARAAALGVERFAWPRVAAQVMEAYEDAVATPVPEGRLERVAVAVGARAADLKPHVPARRLPSLEPRRTVAQRHSKAIAAARRLGLAAVSVGGAVLAFLALQKIGLTNIAKALITASPTLVLVGLGVMCSAMVMRAFSWHAILRAALPRARVRLADAAQGTFIGVLMSSTLPARLGEPSRALVVARRTGRPREHLPIVLGTVVSQTLLNILALIILGAIMFSSVDLFSGHQDALLAAAIAPVVLLVVVLLAPVLLRGTGSRSRTSRLHTLIGQARAGLSRVRDGLIVFRRPRLGLQATVAQLSAWALQALSCWILLVALGLDKHAGIGAAAAVLFAVNITAVLPATPANLGVFQAACAAVLHTGWHIGYGDGVAYGVILQAVEVTTAIVMGMPALLKEGMSWREVRLRAMHSTPVKLPARASGTRAAAAAARVRS
ncbi:MAG TPA: flippase-like domain-containing protein, partial [Solirubrobacteraceae bacterium]|nr:flippase-like domain-containing protein [Solirubrobacteraceae bacterium]